LVGVTAIAAGGNHSLALKSDGAATGTLWVWGDNSFGQLGTGAGASVQSTPQATLTGVTTMAGNLRHTVVAREDGTLSSFGNNNNGQLGDGSTTPSFVPVPVARHRIPADRLEGATVLACGTFNSLAVDRSARAWTWGQTLGMVQRTPLQIAALSGVATLTAGTATAAAITYN